MMQVILLGIEALRSANNFFGKVFAAQVTLAAQVVCHSSSCGFLLLPGFNSSTFNHQKFFNAFGFI
jgi:hypothetical protein